jgi:hypothetical protein
MRRVLATDLGIWPMFLNQNQPSDMMVTNLDYWAKVADYILLYDQIIIPTGNLQILSVLRLMLGDAVFIHLLETKAIVLARFDHWFGYIGTLGIDSYRMDDPPTQFTGESNIATNYFKPLEKAIDIILKVTNPPSTDETKRKIKELLLSNVVEVPSKILLTNARDEAYEDIKKSPYLRDFLSLRNEGRSIKNLLGSDPNQLMIFNPHVLVNKNDPVEIRTVLSVVFENFLLVLGGHTQVSELTGDAASLSVLQAKGQRLGFSPQGQKAFAQIQKVEDVPNLGVAFANKQLSAKQILDLRDSKHTQTLRDWFAQGSPSDTAEETIQRYIETIGKPNLVESLPVKTFRFAVTTLLGIFNPVSGTIASAADNFLLDKCFPGKTPRLFMGQAKALLAQKPIIEKPQKGRINRNHPCPCGSGRSYKKCCAGFGQA